MVGYNSYSAELRSLSVIYENENDKGNEHVCHAIDLVGRDRKGIWVCHDAFTCFKEYYLPAEEFNKSDAEILAEYPNYKDFVTEVDLNDLICLFGDDYTGYLYISAGS